MMMLMIIINKPKAKLTGLGSSYGPCHDNHQLFAASVGNTTCAPGTALLPSYVLWMQQDGH